MKTKILTILLTTASLLHADYSEVVLEDNPLAYYRFEEAADATTAVDSSGNGLDATDITNALFGAVGRVGNAVQFNSDGSILTPITLNPSTGDFTLEAIVNPNMILAAGGVILSNQDGNAGALGRSNIVVSGDNNLNSFTGGVTTNSGVVSEDGTWYHLMLTFDSSAVAGGVDPTLRFYVDGVEQGNSLVVPENANGNWVIGAHKLRNSQWFGGLLDEIAFYDTRLDDPDGDDDMADSRVAAHYDAYLAADVIKSFSADMNSIPDGDSVTLNWTVSDPMTTLTLDDGSGPMDVLGDLVGQTGSLLVSPTENTTYTLSGTGGPLGCSEISQFTVLVDPVPTIASFTSSAADVTEGGAIDLSWTISDADTVTIDNGIGSVDAASGTQSVVINATTTFTLTATNANGTITAEVTVDALPPALIAHWRVGEAVDERSGTILVAEQGAAFDGTFVGTPTFDTTDPAPVPSGSSASIVFDGANSFVDALSFAGIGGKGSRTTAFWFKGPATQTNNNGTLISWGTSANGTRYDIRINNNSSGILRNEVAGSGSNGTAVVADDSWHHCAVVFDPSLGDTVGDVLFYIDGVLDTLSVTGATPIDSSLINNVRIGASRALANRSVTGKMDDIRIYNYALSATEVLALVESTIELKINSVQILADDSVEIRWEGAPGDYSVEFSFDLINWLELDDPSIPTGETSATTIDNFVAPVVENVRVYYRILPTD